MTISEAHKLPPQLCLGCGRQSQLASCTENSPQQKPQEGDVTICIGCGYVMKFDKNLRFRSLTIAEHAEVFSNLHVQRALAVRERVQAERSDSPIFKPETGSQH